MEKISSPESATVGEFECSWFDDGSILDMDYFVETIAGIKAKGFRPDLIGSIIAHYASTWLPDLSGVVVNPYDSHDQPPPPPPPQPQTPQHSESVTSFVMKKRFLVETLIGIIPPEKDSVPCNFLLRLLRTANMVGADPNYKAELEARISWQLDQASLKELMIPSFSHTCETLLDVELVTRLVKKFAALDKEGVKSSSSLVKVAKLVDSYLSEAAIDGDLSLPEFISLADALPNHARVTEDAFYRAIDTYLKAHPKVSKEERKKLCGLIDSNKLSMEATLHAAQNNRLPVRTIIQVLFSEQTKLNHHRHNNNDWCCSSLSGTRSIRNTSGSHYSDSDPTRCMSKREVNVQKVEIKRLREDMVKLKSECVAMQTQIEKLIEKKSDNNGGSKGFFRWKRFGFRNGVSVNVVEEKNCEVFDDNGEREEFEYENQTPGNIKTKLVKGRTPSRWRISLS